MEQEIFKCKRLGSDASYASGRLQSDTGYTPGYAPAGYSASLGGGTAGYNSHPLSALDGCSGVTGGVTNYGYAASPGPCSDLVLTELIGAGGFGAVWRGSWKKVTAAIKVNAFCNIVFCYLPAVCGVQLTRQLVKCHCCDQGVYILFYLLRVRWGPGCRCVMIEFARLQSGRAAAARQSHNPHTLNPQVMYERSTKTDAMKDALQMAVLQNKTLHTHTIHTAHTVHTIHTQPPGHV